MYVTRLAIRGFRSIKHTEIDFNLGKNVLVGRNNSGKSNIVKALDIILGSKHPAFMDLDDSDFYCDENGNRCDEIWILCKIEGNDIDKDQILNLKSAWRYVCNQEDPIYRNADGKIDMDFSIIFFDPEEKVYWHKNDKHNPDSQGKRYYRKSDNDLEKFYNSLCNADAYYFIFRAVSDGSRISSDYRMLYRDKSIGEWCIVWGLTNEFREAFTTSAIMPAFREPNSQLRINNFSWYGKLLKDVWNKGRNNTITHNKINEVIKLIQDAGQPSVPDSFIRA